MRRPHVLHLVWCLWFLAELVTGFSHGLSCHPPGVTPPPLICGIDLDPVQRLGADAAMTLRPLLELEDPDATQQPVRPAK